MQYSNTENTYYQNQPEVANNDSAKYKGSDYQDYHQSTPKKSNFATVFLIVLVSLLVVGIGGYYLWSRSKSEEMSKKIRAVDKQQQDALKEKAVLEQELKGEQQKLNANATGIYTGSINDTQVIVKLRQSGNDLSGLIHYSKSDDDVWLFLENGFISSDGTFSIDEYERKEFKGKSHTATINGTIREGTIEGKFHNIEHDTNYYFMLTI